MPRVSPDQVANSFICLPPPTEQKAIATFLDREAARIDALVAKNESLIHLLRERRSALVERVVTKGLDHAARLRATGLDWAPQIPRHWQLIPLKRLLARMDYGTSESLGSVGPIRVLTMTHIQDGKVIVPDEGSLHELPSGLVLEKDDLLFNRTNSRDLVGKVGLFRGTVEDEVTFASYLVRMMVTNQVSPVWACFLLNSFGFLGLARSMAFLSINQANLNPTRYSQLLVPLPPLNEQATIGNHLTSLTASLDALELTVRQLIDRLLEARGALISAAVTGKIDVRDRAS
jgi:type I restriction enzyme S subunit